jgi:hypothetical protein
MSEMSKDGLRRDGLHGRKTKGRSKRKSEATQAQAENGGWQSGRNDILPSLRIEFYPIEALKTHVRKLRKNDPAHVREVANSISALGFNVPILIGKDNIVIDGDARLEAAKLLGLSAVPCIRVDHLDEMEQRLLRLAVNRLSEKGAWDPDELEVEFKELIIADAPIEISGFGADEVEQLISEFDDDGHEAIDLALSAGCASAREGDLFRLGNHRLICGDATDPL